MWLAINLPVILHRREQRKGWKKIENLYKHYGQQVPPEVLKANEYYKKK